jgi:signal transduction histidine kinase/CheY-like chemotaxis protein/CHASE3 domain sensor protein
MDQYNFRRILSRNIAVPLIAGIVGSGLFLILMFNLLSALNWVEHTDQVLTGAAEASRLSTDLETGLRGFLITGDESFLGPYEASKPRIESDLASLRALVADNSQQVIRVDHVAALQKEWNLFGQAMVELRRAKQDYQQVIRSGRGKRLTDEIRSEFAAFSQTERELRVQRNATASQTTVIVMVLYVVLSLALSAVLAWLGRRDLLQLSGSYGAALQRQQDNAAKLEEQAWLRTGQSQLGEQLVGQLSLPEVGRKALDFMARHIGSVVGAIYIREEHGVLRRVAAYGLAKQAQAGAQVFENHETLVGQAAHEHRLLHLSPAPAGYLKVSSGLGEGTPQSVAVLPLQNEGQVNGVLEIGFMRVLAPRDLSFLELAGSGLGVAVDAARYRQRLQDMLVESQQLNEELQTQEEELRTANEELEEQSRALQEGQTHLQNQQAELEQTNDQLAEQALALDQKNATLQEVHVQLEARADELVKASRYKSEFLANMSHELRTPLNSSLILARLLADNPQGNLSTEQVKFSESIYAAGNDLLNLINDILDIAKVEAGKLELRPEETPLEALVNGLKMTFEPMAAHKGLVFESRLEPGLPTALTTDRQRVEQVLKNLLSNALKFTDRGSVTLAVSPSSGGLDFAVQDSGIGIDPQQQEIIFEAFRQADGTTSRKYGGTGLGLSISRDLARLLGGAISVASTPGQGSRFTLHLPLHWSGPAEDGAAQSEKPRPAPGNPSAAGAQAPLPAPKRAPAPAPIDIPTARAGDPRATFDDDRDQLPHPRRVVLVIEDDATFARILYELAHDMGYSCLVALTGEDGFALATRFVPNALLLDMQLPDTPGMTLLQRLKDNAATRHIPVHIISAEDRSEPALRMGAIGYAVKPTTREELRKIFARLEAKLTQKMKRILLVEDDGLQRESVVRLITDTDIDIRAVETGSEALALLRDEIFDCMIIDLKLSDMQGDELLRRMDAGDIRSFPPVIVYTGRNLTRAEEAELLKYSRSIIIKGARSPERLLDEVTLFLHKVESELSAERQSMLRTARGRDRAFEGRRILVVDDDVRNIFALTSALEHKGVLVEVARNGQEAIDKLESVADIDLVLMDVMMPVMDGLEATRRIRARSGFQKLPIIAVTAKAMKDDQEQCLRAGTNDYVAKPIDLERLFSLMRVWLPNIERM